MNDFAVIVILRFLVLSCLADEKNRYWSNKEREKLQTYLSPTYFKEQRLLKEKKIGESFFKYLLKGQRTLAQEELEKGVRPLAILEEGETRPWWKRFE